MWDLLRDLCGVWDGPRMLIRDFNEAMWQHEHFSETPKPEKQMMDFKEVLSHCDLHDLGFRGLPWTYNNNQAGLRNVRVRLLDRGVANSDWSMLFPNASTQHLTTMHSYHKALLLNTDCSSLAMKKEHSFRYGIMWEREESLQKVIEQSRLHKNPGSDLGALAQSLQVVTQDLRVWSKDNFGNVTRRIVELRRELEQLEWNNPIQNRAKILVAK